MAANAAHFTQTHQIKPSIFEIIAQHSLNTTLQPALQRVVTFLASSNPEKFGWLSRWYEELFLVSNTLLQYHYLRNHAASFAETFYGLQRTSTNTAKGQFAAVDRGVALLALTFVPYLRRKLYARLEEYRAQSLDGALSDDWRGRTKRHACNAQATFELVWAASSVVQYLRYMANRTDVAMPALWIVRQKLVYNADAPQEATGFWTALLKGELNASQISLGLFTNAFSTVFEVSAFFVQFLQSWNSEKAGYNLTALPAVPPPPKDPNAENYHRKCPLCLQPFKIPTVLPVSGYVFCFSCIVKHLRESPKCPVTNLPTRSMDIIRIYDST